MYFSVLPLLLLFASAACARPVHIVRIEDLNMIVGGVELSMYLHENALYNQCSEAFEELKETSEWKGWHDRKNIDGVKGALKMKRDEEIVARVEVPDADVKLVMEMIHHHRESFIYWGWALPSHTHVTFILEITPGGEEIIKQCLGKHTANTNHQDSGGTMT